MTAPAIQIPFAERNDQLVHVSGVESGLACSCVCPLCKEPVVARKGEIRRHHFAHFRQGECRPESVLHRLAKRLLCERLERLLAENRSMPIEWTCSRCPDTHRGNLLKRAKTVDSERPIGSYRPDVTLADAQKSPVALIEMVVTHPPDSSLLEWCRGENIPLLIFQVKDGPDLLSIQHERPLRPSKVSICLRDTCDRCGYPLSEAELHVLDTNCWKCGFAMKVALIRADGMVAGPEYFSPRQSERARDQGAELRTAHSSSSATTYLANTCPTCGSLYGSPYLRYFSRRTAEMDGTSVGKVCLHCTSQRNRNIRQ
ncbi:MAG: competence protein CoiA family protein [Planctomycetota bacterium]